MTFDSPPRRWTKMRIALLGGVLILAVLVGLAVIFELRAKSEQAEIDRRLDAIRAAGEPVSIAEIEARSPKKIPEGGRRASRARTGAPEEAQQDQFPFGLAGRIHSAGTPRRVGRTSRGEPASDGPRAHDAERLLGRPTTVVGPEKQTPRQIVLEECLGPGGERTV